MEGTTLQDEGQFLSAEETDELLREMFSKYTEPQPDGANVMTFDDWVDLIYDLEIQDDERVTQVIHAPYACSDTKNKRCLAQHTHSCTMYADVSNPDPPNGM
jgi:hypothetical protein